MSDNVNKPSHYNQGGIECIDAIQAALTPEEFRGFLKGNIIKYTWREKNKNGDEDLRKMHWYAGRLTKLNVTVNNPQAVSVTSSEVKSEIPLYSHAVASGIGLGTVMYEYSQDPDEYQPVKIYFDIGQGTPKHIILAMSIGQHCIMRSDSYARKVQEIHGLEHLSGMLGTMAGYPGDIDNRMPVLFNGVLVNVPCKILLPSSLPF